VEPVICDQVKIPPRLAAFMKGEKQSIEMRNSFTDFKAFLMKH
jgi:threonine synthase